MTPWHRQPGMNVAVAAILAAAALPVAGAEVYRCESDGVIRFSDRPCGKAAQTVNIKEPIVLPAGPKADLLEQAERRTQEDREARDQADAAWLELHEAQKADDERLRSARIHNEVAVGMSQADVRRMRGEPAVMSRGSSSSGDRETWSYVLDSGERLHVTFVDGRVKSVRTRKDKK